MPTTLALGPLLGFENDNIYTVCILIDDTVQIPPQLFYSEYSRQSILLRSDSVKFNQIAEVGSYRFWRAEFRLLDKDDDRDIRYRICDGNDNGVSINDCHDRTSWSFFVPKTSSQGEDGPRIAYCSCNGFSSAKLLRDEKDPYAMWGRMKIEHNKFPYSLLLMGGDQVYADQLWESSCRPKLNEWCNLSWGNQNSAQVTQEMRVEIRDFYNSLYVKQWSQKDVSEMLASVPSIMMWDDHDIIDGWGSYPWDRQNCPVFKEIFDQAKSVFDLFQLRGSTRNRLNTESDHRTLSVSFFHYQILALDNRSERTTDPNRQPGERIMSPKHWTDLKSWFDQVKAGKFTCTELIVMTGVPIVYRSLATAEFIVDRIPYTELDDDIKDHWSAKSNIQERMRLIVVLLKSLEGKHYRAIILSGDVHVGCLGQIRDNRSNVRVTQVVSSGIVHPPPSELEWKAIMLVTNNKPEQQIGGDIVLESLQPQGGDLYLRCRNYAHLYRGTDHQLWINWICEKKGNRIFEETPQPCHTVSGTPR